MKVVIAPDSFKESLSALEACHAIEKGMRAVYPEADIVNVPMADGGRARCSPWWMRQVDDWFTPK